MSSMLNDWLVFLAFSFGLIAAVVVLVIGVAFVIDWYQGPIKYISLREDSWDCTATVPRTRLVMNGKVLVPQAYGHCVAYRARSK